MEGRKKKKKKERRKKKVKKGRKNVKRGLLLFIMPNLFSYWHPPDVALDQKINIKT